MLITISCALIGHVRNNITFMQLVPGDDREVRNISIRGMAMCNYICCDTFQLNVSYTL